MYIAASNIVIVVAFGVAIVPGSNTATTNATPTTTAIFTASAATNNSATGTEPRVAAGAHNRVHALRSIVPASDVERSPPPARIATSLPVRVGAVVQQEADSAHLALARRLDQRRGGQGHKVEASEISSGAPYRGLAVLHVLCDLTVLRRWSAAASLGGCIDGTHAVRARAPERGARSKELQEDSEVPRSSSLEETHRAPEEVRKVHAQKLVKPFSNYVCFAFFAALSSGGAECSPRSPYVFMVYRPVRSLYCV